MSSLEMCSLVTSPCKAGGARPPECGAKIADAGSHIAIVDVGAIDFQEAVERLAPASGSLEGAGQFVVDGVVRLVVGGVFQGANEPLDGGLGHGLLDEAGGQPDVGLMSALRAQAVPREAAHLLQLAD